MLKTFYFCFFNTAKVNISTMKRNEFIKSSLGLSAMLTLGGLKTQLDQLEEQDEEMPVLFVGHGSPMNALEDNEFTIAWKAVANSIPKPTAILCISAHWETKGTFVTAMEKPKTIHDFGGFPRALHEVEYAAAGSPWLAKETQKAITSTTVGLDDAWGFDHGSWSVLKQMYPLADVPMVQMSLDYTKNAQYHYDLAKELASLRKKGVLIVGSGNMVHNFQYANFRSTVAMDWAIEADALFKKFITEGNHQPLINYQKEGKPFQLSAPTPEHYLPMLYAVALQGKKDKVSLFNDKIVGGSFSMTSVKIEKA
jgi:4,5-DOPA dioxygenase extradiol